MIQGEESVGLSQTKQNIGRNKQLRKLEYDVHLHRYRIDQWRPINIPELCMVCKKTTFNNYVVKNDVWLTAFKRVKGRMAHIGCLDKKLIKTRGHGLKKEDFPELPINEIILFAFKIKE